MRFDNKQFEQNVHTSISTLDKLKQKLNLSDASKGLENVNSAAKKVDMTPLANGVETVGLKFNAMYTMADQALRNIVNSAMYAGKRIVSALTIDPVKMGFSEYETQINAVQTIMANTESKGTTLDDVNSALDELNTYADKTIYNFTEMTRNIGTFTAAGVDLDTSVSAIQGIANLAAVSGSTSQQASTAMYQLSQAMASGTVKLMDWNSVVNAGMGGEVFQNALKRTAKAHGIAIDDIIAKNGSFRESLHEGWLTTDILTETLRNFTLTVEGAEEGTEEYKKKWDELKESLKGQGYTEAQAEEILKMANTATDAATKVKTFSQLFDTMKEAAQSGWAQTWEIIVGDFEEAKAFLTTLSDTFGNIIGDSAASRNELLENWKVMGGRTDLIDSLQNVFDAIGSIVKPIKEAFREIFPPTTAEQLVSITKGIKDFTSKLKIGDETADKLRRTFRGLFAIIDIVKQVVGAAFRGFKSLFEVFGDIGGGLLGATASLGDWVVRLNDAIKSSGIFNKIFLGIADILKAVFRLASKFISVIKNNFVLPGWEVFHSLLARIHEKMSEVGSAAGGMKDGVVSAFDGMGSALENCGFVKLIDSLWNGIKIIGSGIAKVFGVLAGGLVDVVGNFNFDNLLDLINAISFSSIAIFVAKFVNGLSEITDSVGDFKENVLDILDSVRGCFEAYQNNLKAAALMKIAGAIAILAAALVVLSVIDGDKLSSALGAITMLFTELMLSMAIITKMDMGGLGILKLSFALGKLSTSLLVLAVAAKIMSTMSWSELAIGLVGIAGGLAALVIAVNLLPDKKVTSAAVAIRKMSTALLILSLALKIMSTMSWEEMGVGLTAMAVSLAALVAAVHLLPRDLAIRVLGITSLATAMVILSGALKIMSTMSWEEMIIGLTGLAGSMAILVVSLNLMKRALPGALAMFVVAPALIVLSGALKIMSTMSWEEVSKGLVAFGGSLLILAVGLAAMKTALPGALAMLIISPALITLSIALSILGAMSWASIAKGLISLAGAFAIIGVAGLLLAPLILPIIGLAAALALIGAGVLTAGVGLTMMAAGITALSIALTAGATAIVSSLTMIIMGVVNLIPAIIKKIGEGLIALCGVIAEGAPAIGEAVKALIISLCDILIECIPVIADTVLKLLVGLLDALAGYAPKIVNALFDFVINIINGIADRIPDFVKAIISLISSIFTGVIEALSELDTNAIINGLLAVGLMAGIIAALGAIVPLIPGAMVGVVGMGIVVAELAVVLAAIGALAQIPGLQWLVSEGGDFLQTIGTAIGQFIGGLVGGVAQGFTSSLPQIGTDLSTFMKNLQPFIEGAKLIDGSVLSGVKSLVGVILAITGVNLIEKLASWATGGSSIASFASELPLLGQGLKGFSDAVAGVVPENIIAASNAAKALAEMTSVIPNSGGVVSWFAGDNSISKFASELPLLGQGLKGFSDSVVGIIPENITAASTAAKTLAEMTSVIPNQGGMVAWFSGENSISKFAGDIVTLGYGLKGFSDSIAGVVPENIIAGANAAKALAEMTAVIPNEGGIVAWFTGESSITRFAGQLPILGSGLKGFSDSITGIMPENLIAASNAAKALADMTAAIPNEGGIKAWFVGEASVTKFAGNLPLLGAGLKGFSDSVMGIMPENLIAASNAAKSLAEMTTFIPNEGGIKAWFVGESGVANFADKLPTLGAGLKGFSDSVAGVNSENLIAASNAAKALAEMTAVIPKEGGIKAWFTGETSITKFADKLPGLGEGLKGFSDSVAGINPENVTAAADAAKSLGNMLKNMPDKPKKISQFGDKLEGFGKDLKAYFKSLGEVSTESLSASDNALKSISKLSSLDAGNIKAVAKALEDLTKAVKDMGENVKTDLTNAGKEAIEGFIKGIEDKMATAKKVCKTLIKECAKVMSENTTPFENAGRDVVKGFARGISENTYRAEAKAKAMAKAAAKAAEEELDINSPSKVFRDIGYSIPEGFALGIDKMRSVVLASSTSMGDTAMSGVRNSISKLANIINGDMDVQPTIRPVLDLSDVRSGANSISNMLGNGTSIGVMSNVGAINSMMNRQNGGNGDVVSAIDDLRKEFSKELSNVGNVYYSINGLTYDDGSDVADAFKTIIQAAKIERRV